MVELNIPPQVGKVLERLTAHTYKAFIVGKCVRELVKDNNIMDYDVITDATIDRIVRIFDNYTVIKENEEQGELVIAILGISILISPFKSGFNEKGEPIYTDSIEEDLKRRDFSFNAIAYHPKEGYVDPFNGLDCLLSETKIIAAINENYSPSSESDEIFVSTFEKNPVTILYALGYYSTGDYKISEATKSLIIKNKGCINKISPENLRIELSWVIKGKKTALVLDEYREVFAELIPEFKPTMGFEQNQNEHSYDLYTHTVKSVGYSSPILTLRYAMLFHTLGKPDCHSLDHRGVGHYYGHAERAEIYAERIMTRLGFKSDDIKDVCFLIKNHDLDFSPDRRSVKILLRKIQPDKLKLLMQLKYADMRAKSDEFEGAALKYKRLVDMINEITALKECFTIQQLAVNRYDLIQQGVVRTDEEAEIMLERLLDLVLDSPALNTRTRLLDISTRTAKPFRNCP